MPGANCEYPPNRSNDSNSDSLGEHHISNTILNSDSLVIGWRFVVGTYDNDFLRLYVDGELVAEHFVENNVTLENSDSPLYIGRECKEVDGPGTNRFFYGAIDNVMIYDYALSNSLVNILYSLKQE
jgi:hypothetical protein